MLRSIIGMIVVVLLAIWFVGVFIAHVAVFIWLALLLAVCLAMYGVIAGRRGV